MMLQFCLLISTLPLQGITGCRTYLTRSERGGAYFKRREPSDGGTRRATKRGGGRAGRTFEGEIPSSAMPLPPTPKPQTLPTNPPQPQNIQQTDFVQNPGVCVGPGRL